MLSLSLYVSYASLVLDHSFRGAARKAANPRAVANWTDELKQILASGGLR